MIAEKSFYIVFVRITIDGLFMRLNTNETKLFSGIFNIKSPEVNWISLAFFQYDQSLENQKGSNMKFLFQLF